MRVIVVGAGPAGLTAAHALTAAGVDVTVLERDATPGGRAGVAELRVETQPWRFDRGPAGLAGYHDAARYLARRVGLPRRDMVRLVDDHDLVIDGTRYPAPDGPRALLTSKLLSAGSKARAARLRTRLAARGPHWTRLAAAAKLDDRDADEYFRTAVGADYADTILPDLMPLSPPAQTSRVVAMARFGEDTTAWAPYGGLGTLWSTVAGPLHIRYGVAAAELRQFRASVTVTTADGEELTADAAVIAAPASVAAKLLPPDHQDRPLAEAATSAPAVKLHLALAASVDGRRPVRPGGAGRHTLAAATPLEVNATGQTPRGRGSLTVCAAPDLSADLLGEPDRAVRSMLLAEAQRLLGGPVGDILGWSVVRLPEAMPIFTVGWLRRLAAREPGRDRIHLAGDWLDSPSIEGAVRSALHVSASILRTRPNPAPPAATGR